MIKRRRRRSIRIGASLLAWFRFCVGLAAALYRDPATADLAPEVKSKVQVLGAARAEINAATDRRIERRSELDVEENALLRTFDQVEGAATLYDPSGSLLRFVLPHGKGSLVASNVPQLDAAGALIIKLESCQVGGGDLLRAACLDLLRRQVQAVQEARDALDAADRGIAEARRAANEAREDLRIHVSMVRGELRVRFPHDPRRQASYFPVVHGGDSVLAADEGEEDEDAGIVEVAEIPGAEDEEVNRSA